MARMTVEIDVRRRGRRRAHGCRCEARRRRKLLRFARVVARRVALGDRQGLATVDDVHERLARAGHPPSALGYASGSVFRTAAWRATLVRVRSRRPGNRGRLLVLWEYGGKKGGASSPPGGGSCLVAERTCAAEVLRALRRLGLEETLIRLAPGAVGDGAE
jgi:hypothetical protein